MANEFYKIFENWRSYLFKEGRIDRAETKITEDSQGNMKNQLGFPAGLAEFYQKTFRKNAWTVAKWTTELYGKGLEKLPDLRELKLRSEIIEKLRSMISLPYEEREKESEEIKYYYEEKFDLWIPIYGYENEDINETIEGFLVGFSSFLISIFQSDIVRDIISGKLTDLNPYKNLSFSEAKEKYYKRIQIQNSEILVDYGNFVWVNTGLEKCQIIGNRMNNCGSAATMSPDKEKNIIVLLDKNKDPHIIATWGVNTKSLRGIQGKASSVPKEKYWPYIQDLVRVLGAEKVVATGMTTNTNKVPWPVVNLLFQPNKIHEWKYIGTIPENSLYGEIFLFEVEGIKIITNAKIYGKEEQFIKFLPFEEKYLDFYYQTLMNLIEKEGMTQRL